MEGLLGELAVVSRQIDDDEARSLALSDEISRVTKTLADSKCREDVQADQSQQLCTHVDNVLKHFLRSAHCFTDSKEPSHHHGDPVSAACLSLSANCVRCLRNLCAGHAEHQLVIGASSVIQTATKLLDVLLASQHDAESASRWPLVRVLLQLCGNLAAGCEENVPVLWPLLFPSIFASAVSCPDMQTVNFSVMVVHTCLAVDTSRRSYLYTDVSRGRPLLAQLLLLTKRQDLSDWPLLLGEQLTMGSDFSNVFEALSDCLAARVILVDILTATLSTNPDATVSPSTSVSLQSGNALFAETLLFLAAQCQVWSKRLPAVAPPQEELSPEVQLALSVIQYISHASSRADGIQILRKSPGIFSTLLSALQHLTPPASTVASKTFVSEEVGKKCTYYGLKRDLMRCMANLLSVLEFKDQLQADEGMVALLNNCGVDHRNPYIAQWAILAIHNACEDHRGNQTVIAGLKKEGKADMSLLRKMGMDVVVADDGSVRVKAAALPD